MDESHLDYDDCSCYIECSIPEKSDEVMKFYHVQSIFKKRLVLKMDIFNRTIETHKVIFMK